MTTEKLECPICGKPIDPKYKPIGIIADGLKEK